MTDFSSVAKSPPQRSVLPTLPSKIKSPTKTHVFPPSSNTNARLPGQCPGTSTHFILKPAYSRTSPSFASTPIDILSSGAPANRRLCWKSGSSISGRPSAPATIGTSNSREILPASPMWSQCPWVSRTASSLRLSSLRRAEISPKAPDGASMSTASRNFSQETRYALVSSGPDGNISIFILPFCLDNCRLQATFRAGFSTRQPACRACAGRIRARRSGICGHSRALLVPSMPGSRISPN